MDQLLSPEVLGKIQDTAVRAEGFNVANRVVTKGIPEDPEKFLIIDKDATHVVMDRPQPRRSNVLLSCADVVAYAKWMLDTHEMSPIIWISPTAIVVQDDDNRLRGDFGKYELETTDLFDCIAGLGKGPNGDGSYTQKDFLRLLRVPLAKAFADPDFRVNFIGTVRKLVKKSASNIGQGSGSYEAGLLDQQSQLITWPDSLLLATTVFEDPSFTATYPVEVVLDVRPEEPAPFSLAPLPADLTLARQKALDHASELIRHGLPDGIEVFLGAPSRKSD